jgi:hypothetical protein
VCGQHLCGAALRAVPTWDFGPACFVVCCPQILSVAPSINHNQTKYDFAETFCAARPVLFTRSKELESAGIEARQVDGAKRPVKAVGTFHEPKARGAFPRTTDVLAAVAGDMSPSSPDGQDPTRAYRWPLDTTGGM